MLLLMCMHTNHEFYNNYYNYMDYNNARILDYNNYYNYNVPGATRVLLMY